MRKYFPLPTVLSVLALVVAMSGTAAAVSKVLIKHNSQVAAHTIAGANAPKGDKKNIIPGSIGSGDLHSRAVTNAKLGSSAVKAPNLASGAVTNSKIGSGAVTNAKIGSGAVTSSKLSFPTFNATEPKTDNTERTLVSTDGLKVTYKCSTDFNDPQLAVFISSSAPGAFATGEVNDIDNSTTTSLHAAIPAFEETLTTAGSDASTSQTAVTLTYQAGAHVGLLTVNGTANVLTSTCTVQGAFVPLT
jgi:hypothetical protein